VGAKPLSDGVSRGRVPVVFAPGAGPEFPDPERAGPRGLVAAGGSLSPAWLLTAYRRGIFPWYDVDTPPLWWSPDPRQVLDPETLHVSRSMRRFLRAMPFRVHHNRDFAGVIRACASEREEGTWILPEMISAYTELHRLGYAHSIEVWENEALVGGLYGVQCGGLFAAESMFHRATNASKVALIAAVRGLFAAGTTLFDVQFPTAHLTSLGTYSVSRREYLARLAEATKREVDLRGLETQLTRALEL
jgi:leucyl/phenylalanyl-tRNA--protein transferase